MGVMAGAIAAIVYFLGETKDRHVAHYLALALLIPIVIATFGIGGLHVQQPDPDLLDPGSQDPEKAMIGATGALEQLYLDNERVVRRRAIAVQGALATLVLLVLSIVGAMVYWY